MPPIAEPVRSESEIEVRYAETDQMGVVHHANYIIWFELVRNHLFGLADFHYADVERMGYLLMVTRVEVSYRQPARYGDVVRVSCWGERLGSRWLRIAYEVRKGDELLVTGVTEHVFVDAATRRPCRAPDSIRGAFRKLAGLPPD